MALEKRLESFHPARTSLDEARRFVSDECLKAADLPPGFFTLTVPTGGGKTLASMRFALKHILINKDKMNRVIYAIPYTSIIEQNAQVYRELFGEHNVLEVHSSCSVDDDRWEEGNLARLAAENWDAPIVVTTNVQFFESLFASKPSKCRKLHNIAGSVIVLDEAQMLPIERLEQCVRSLVELVQNYGCTVVLCTATQPALNEMIGQYGLCVSEIISDPDALKERLKRVRYRNLGALSDESLADRIAQHSQCLCIVNSRAQAKALYRLLDCREGVFHLSTLMHSRHRRGVLAEVRRRLKADPPEPCLVVSTSLIEAGVDVDFPVVYRALAGVDSIIQSGGRCNREGLRSVEQSEVFLFEPSGDYGIPRDVREKSAIAIAIFSETDSRNGPSGIDIEGNDSVNSYFSQLHRIRRMDMDKDSILNALSSVKLGLGFSSIPFDKVARSFEMIENGAVSLVIQCDEILSEIERLRLGFADMRALRKLYQYSVTVYPNAVQRMVEMGRVEVVNGVYLLIDESCYDENVGVEDNPSGGNGLFW